VPLQRRAPTVSGGRCRAGSVIGSAVSSRMVSVHMRRRSLQSASPPRPLRETPCRPPKGHPDRVGGFACSRWSRVADFFGVGRIRERCANHLEGRSLTLWRAAQDKPGLVRGCVDCTEASRRVAQQQQREAKTITLRFRGSCSVAERRPVNATAPSRRIRCLARSRHSCGHGAARRAPWCPHR
jgi:hypothetical protein